MTTIFHITTRLSGVDDLTADDYRDIYNELRSKMPLRRFVAFIGSTVSFTWWSLYEGGERPLSDDRRNELRRAVGLPPLAPTVVGALASAVADDAHIYRIGDTPAHTVILSSVPEPITICLDNGVHILPAGPAVNASVTPVTRPRNRAPRKTIELSPTTWKRLNSARPAGQTWDDYLSALAP